MDSSFGGRTTDLYDKGCGYRDRGSIGTSINQPNLPQDFCINFIFKERTFSITLTNVTAPPSPLLPFIKLYFHLKYLLQSDLCVWNIVSDCVFFIQNLSTRPNTTPNHTHRVASTKEYRIRSDLLTAKSSVLKMHLILIRHYNTIEDSGILKPRRDFTKTEISMDFDTSIGRRHYSFTGPRWRSLGFYKKNNN